MRPRTKVRGRKKFHCMQIKRFKYLKEKGISDHVIFDIVKYTVIPSLNISFDEIVFRTLKLVPVQKLLNCPAWELYLNVLIQEYKISKSTVEDAVKRGLEKLKLS